MSTDDLDLDGPERGVPGLFLLTLPLALARAAWRRWARWA